MEYSRTCKTRELSISSLLFIGQSGAVAQRLELRSVNKQGTGVRVHCSCFGATSFTLPYLRVSEETLQPFLSVLSVFRVIRSSGSPKIIDTRGMFTFLCRLKYLSSDYRKETMYVTPRSSQLNWDSHHTRRLI